MNPYSTEAEVQPTDTYENKHVEKLVHMSNVYPELLQEKKVREVYGTGAGLWRDESGHWTIRVHL